MIGLDRFVEKTAQSLLSTVIGVIMLMSIGIGLINMFSAISRVDDSSGMSEELTIVLNDFIQDVRNSNYPTLSDSYSDKNFTNYSDDYIIKTTTEKSSDCDENNICGLTIIKAQIYDKKDNLLVTTNINRAITQFITKTETEYATESMLNVPLPENAVGIKFKMWGAGGGGGGQLVTSGSNLVGSVLILGTSQVPSNVIQQGMRSTGASRYSVYSYYAGQSDSGNLRTTVYFYKDYTIAYYGGAGGASGYVVSNKYIPIIPTDTLQIIVGSKGKRGIVGTTNVTTNGTYGNGGDGGASGVSGSTGSGGSGGGASSVSINGSVIAIAGGGGGGGGGADQKIGGNANLCSIQATSTLEENGLSSPASGAGGGGGGGGYLFGGKGGQYGGSVSAEGGCYGNSYISNINDMLIENPTGNTAGNSADTDRGMAGNAGYYISNNYQEAQNGKIILEIKSEKSWTI